MAASDESLTTRAAVIDAAGAAPAWREVRLSPPRAGEIWVDIRAAGICATDLAAQAGGYGTPLPAVLGHEGVGLVRALGPDVEGLAVGDCVVLSFGSCGRCDSCRTGLPGYCPKSFNFNIRATREDRSPVMHLPDGTALSSHFFAQSSFAETTVVRANSAVRIDTAVDDALLAPLGCGVLTGVGMVENIARPGPDDPVLVLGCGTVGLAAVMAAKRRGVRTVLAVERDPGRRTRAHGFGATVVDSLTQLPARPQAVLDTTGSAVLMSQALGRSALRALLVCAATTTADAWRFAPTDLVYGGRRVQGTVEGDADPQVLIPQIARWVAAGEFALAPLVARYEFADIAQAFADLAARRVLKPVLVRDVA